MARFSKILLGLAIAAGFVARGEAQTAGLGIRPMRLEMEVMPGKSKTASFTIESPPADSEVRGRLILSLTDWMVHEDTSVTYHDAGTLPQSSSSWFTFSPTDLTISSGQDRLVRVTANVPAGTPPGLYRSAIFVQERPPAKQPQKGEQLIFFRFRYVVSLYVIVQPVSAHGEVSDVHVASDSRGSFLVCQIKNTGTLHLRPYITWFLRSGQKELAAEKNVEATVLLPGDTNNEPLALQNPLPPGEYEIEAQVDFRNGQPIQAVKRKVQILAPASNN